MSPVGTLTGSLLVPSVRVRDSRFLDAAMAACALVADAGGRVGTGKRTSPHGFLGAVEALRVFDGHVVANSFEAFVNLIRRRGEGGRVQALKAISDIAGDTEGAREVIGIGLAMARAQGELSPAVRERIELVASAAGLSAANSKGQPVKYSCTRERQPHVITLAGAKGGTGKSTAAVHLAVGLIKLGHSVGSIDLDGSQGTISRYFANRASLADETGRDLGMPRHRRVAPALQTDRDRARDEEDASFADALADLSDCAYVVIDTPGNDCHLARLGCEHADTLITPLNDSLLDIDTLARIDRMKREVLGPSAYCKWVWEENDRRVARGRRPIDWIVMRNRLAHIAARNNREVHRLLQQLARRIGFRLAHGLGERVVFRELFLDGLTLLDLSEDETDARGPTSHIHARHEIEELLRAVGTTG